MSTGLLVPQSAWEAQPAFFIMVWDEGAHGALCPQCHESHEYYSPTRLACPEQPPCRALVNVYPARIAALVEKQMKLDRSLDRRLTEDQVRAMSPLPWLRDPDTGEGAIYTPQEARAIALRQVNQTILSGLK